MSDHARLPSGVRQVLLGVIDNNEKSMKKAFIKILTLMLVLVSMASCSKNLYVIGEYKSTHDNQNAVLQVNPDSTFNYSESGTFDGCMSWPGSKATGTWSIENKKITFSIDTMLKPKIQFLTPENETLKVRFKNKSGEKATFRTTVGVNHNNTITNRLDHRNYKTNDFSTSKYKNVDKIMVYLLGSETYLFIPTNRKPQNILIENFQDYVFFELEEIDFKVSKDLIKGELLQEYANHGKRELNKRKLKLKKVYNK